MTNQNRSSKKLFGPLFFQILFSLCLSLSLFFFMGKMTSPCVVTPKPSGLTSYDPKPSVASSSPGPAVIATTTATTTVPPPQHSGYPYYKYDQHPPYPPMSHHSRPLLSPLPHPRHSPLDPGNSTTTSVVYPPSPGSYKHDGYGTTVPLHHHPLGHALPPLTSAHHYIQHQTLPDSNRTRRPPPTTRTNTSTRTGKEKRTFACQVSECGKVFKRSEHLKRHIRSIHTNEKRKPKEKKQKKCKDG